MNKTDNEILSDILYTEIKKSHKKDEILLTLINDYVIDKSHTDIRKFIDEIRNIK